MNVLADIFLKGSGSKNFLKIALYSYKEDLHYIVIPVDLEPGYQTKHIKVSVLNCEKLVVLCLFSVCLLPIMKSHLSKIPDATLFKHQICSNWLWFCNIVIGKFSFMFGLDIV